LAFIFDTPQTAVDLQFPTCVSIAPRMSAISNKDISEETFDFVETPRAPQTKPAQDCGVRTTSVGIEEEYTLLPRFLTLDIVPSNQECSSSGGCGWQRQLLQHSSLLWSRSSPAVLLLEGWRWSLSRNLLRHLHFYTYSCCILDICFNLFASQE